jgi:hypothetical protein
MKSAYPNSGRPLLQEPEMKKKEKKLKKLSVSKETLRSLEDSNLEAAQGAIGSDKSNCITCSYTCP